MNILSQFASLKFNRKMKKKDNVQIKFKKKLNRSKMNKHKCKRILSFKIHF